MDTGCSNRGKFTAMRLGNERIFSNRCRIKSHPGLGSSSWIMKCIHIIHPADRPVAVQNCQADLVQLKTCWNEASVGQLWPLCERSDAICGLVFLYLSVSAFSALTSVESCQLIGNGTFGDFALITQSWALFSASVKMGFFMYIFMPGYLCFL